MEIQFDFLLHSDPSALVGTQYFELLPDHYGNKHWVPGSRFIYEDTFCLIEGVFEHRVADYDHFAFAEVRRPTWELILRDLAALRSALVSAPQGTKVALPYGSTVNVQADFEQALDTNQRSLAVLLVNLESWLRLTLVEQEVVSVLGL